MAEDDPRERVWSYVASRVAEGFGLFTGRSPTLTATINHGARYVKPAEDEVLFDARALTLGLLAAGTSDPTGITFSNAAMWFREWVEGRTVADAVGVALVRFATEVEAVERALDRKAPVGLSISVQDLLSRAGRICDATLGHTAFEGRHLFAAMLAKGTIAEQLPQLLDLSVTADDIRDLKTFLVDKILLSPAAGETRDRWIAALDLPSSPPPPPPPLPEPPGQEIIRFSHDGARRGENVLETKRDVEALAKLICLKGSTPLAVAIFGGWGSGKTTFMDALDEKIDAIAVAEALRTSSGAAGPLVTRIVQIKFNAWQFVDANLWASLTAEFFDQLRAGGWRRAGTVRHAGLVERVNSHVHSLSAEAAAHRAAVVESNRQVLEAQEARDVAAKAVREAAAKAMSQAAMDTLGEIYDGQKANLRALGIAAGGQDPTQGVDAVIEAVRSSRSTARQAGTVLRMVWKYRAATAGLGAFLFLLAAGLALWMLWSESFEGMDSAATVATVLGVLGSVAAFWRAAAPAFRLVGGVARRGAHLAQTLETADKDAVKELIGKEAALRDATAEAEAQARVAERAERALARYVDPTGPS
ncbi:MAG TPA: P-loop NTPase fold protein, partial [Allosphingosinicella sp.]